jgi:hypothetical protein
MAPASAQAITPCFGTLKMPDPSYVREFFVEAPRTLNKVLRTNFEFYTLLRKIQDQLLRGPDPELQDLTCFKDALGRTQNLQYD